MKLSTPRANSARIMRSLIAVLLAIAAVFAFSACKSNEIDPSGTVDIGGNDATGGKAPSIPVQTADASQLVRVSLTIDATRAYNSAVLPQNIKDVLQNDGMLIKNATLTVAKGTAVSGIFELLRVYDIAVVSEQGPVGTFVTSIQGLENGTCGASSGWLFRINGEFPSEGVDSVELHDGDVVEWVFSCDGGADAGMSTAQ